MAVRKIIAISSFLALGLASCDADAEAMVFIVSYHNVDYARHACEHVVSMEPDARRTIRNLEGRDSGFEPADWVKQTVVAATECRSVKDYRELGRRLENELIDALAVETSCGGVTAVRDPHPDFDKMKEGYSQTNYDLRQKNPYWDLHLDYQPGSKEFGWTLFQNEAGMKPVGAMVSGEGNVKKAAGQICTVVTRRGATIR